MKTQDEIKAEALRRITEYVRDNCRTVNSDERYDKMLDECFSFDSVGGPFAHMAPSRVLAEVDPVAYRCGKNDWMDGEDIREFDGDEWEGRDLDEAKEAVEYALDSEISDKETEAEEAESAVEKSEERVEAASEDDSADSLDEAKEELSSARSSLNAVESEIDELNAILAAVKAYTF